MDSHPGAGLVAAPGGRETVAPQRSATEDERRAHDVQEHAVVCFSVAGQLQAISVAQVAEVVQPPPITGLFRLPDFVLGAVSLRGEILAVLDLAKLSGVGETALLDQTRLIVVQAESVRFGLLVDEILGSLSLSPTAISEAQAPGSPAWIIGVANHDERPVAIVDVTRIAQSPTLDEVRSAGRAPVLTKREQHDRPSVEGKESFP